MKGSVLVYVYGKFAILGVAVGIFSSLFGVGGGIIMVPALALIAGLPQHLAQGTSLAVMVPTALVGAYRYFRAGNVQWGLALPLCLGAIPAAHFGAQMAQRLPQATLRAMFALFMVAVAARIMPTASLRGMSMLLGMAMVAVGVRLLFAR